MKKTTSLALLFAMLLLANVSCERKPSVSIENNEEYVNKWIYKQMEIFYFWNYTIPKTPNYTAQPKSFFDGLLNKFHPTSNTQGDRFSVIREDYAELINSLSGISSSEIGFEYTFTRIKKGKPEVAIIVLYSKKGTDAHAKGIKRGQWITAVNGTTVTDANYRTILSGSGAKKLSTMEFVYNRESKKYEVKQLPDITVQIHSEFAEKPIYMDTVYTLNNQKIGYMVYNFFATGPQNKNFDYDKELMNRLSAIQSQNISNFVLDLRYNSGGAVLSAVALASALVKNRSTKELLVRMEYNSIVQPEMEKEYGKDFFNTYFADKIMDGENKIADIPKLNIPNLYVITGKYTASASELIINGLKPYMNVTIIGDTTVGKNVGSNPFYEKNNPGNKWGILPITFKYYNSKGESDFTSGFKPEAANTINEYQYPLIEFGNTKEPLLNRALSIIIGNNLALRSAQLTPDKEFETEILSLPRKRPSELYDNIRDNALQRFIQQK